MSYAVSQPQVIFSTGSLYPLDTAHCFALAAEAGCDGVEIMCDARWSTRDPVYLQELSERYAQPVRVLHTPFARAYKGARGRVCHLHLSNYDGRQHRLPYQGRLDLGALLRQLVVEGFAGTVCLELHPDALGFPNMTLVRTNLHASVAFCRVVSSTFCKSSGCSLRSVFLRSGRREREIAFARLPLVTRFHQNGAHQA